MHLNILTLKQTLLDLPLRYINSKKMDSQTKEAHNAGEAKGQAQEKTSNLMDRAADSAQSAKESMEEGGQQMKDKAQGAADAAKDAMNKN